MEAGDEFRIHDSHVWDVVDYDVIRERMNELHEGYDIREIAIDPWNATVSRWSRSVRATNP